MTMRRGFTLVEMLVSMGILAVITGMVTANIRFGSRGDEVRQAVQLLTSELRQAQTYAVSGKTVLLCRAGSLIGQLCPSGLDEDCGAEGDCREDVPTGGYGVHLSTTTADQRQMTLFVDANGNRLFDGGEELRRQGLATSGRVLLQSVTPQLGTSLDVVFSPPDGSVRFNGAIDMVTAQVAVVHESGGQTLGVRVNRISGQIGHD